MDGLVERLEIAQHTDRPDPRSGRPRIVIVGAGFGGLSVDTARPG